MGSKSGACFLIYTTVLFLFILGSRYIDSPGSLNGLKKRKDDGQIVYRTILVGGIEVACVCGERRVRVCMSQKKEKRMRTP